MRKLNGAPFIRHGVTLPYLAYTYKCLNCDSSAITEDYLWNIITSLEKAGSTLFIYQYCSDIEEFVIALFSKQYDDTIKEQSIQRLLSSSFHLFLTLSSLLGYFFFSVYMITFSNSIGKPKKCHPYCQPNKNKSLCHIHQLGIQGISEF